MIPEILGVIPARGGSKGVRRKNVRMLAGKPLIHYTVEAAQQSRVLSRIVVSTDDAKITSLCEGWDCEVLQRPADLAQDDTPMVPVMQHVIHSLWDKQDYVAEITVILQPTAPLRQSVHIDEAIALLQESGAGSVVSVSAVPGHYHPHWQFSIANEGELKLLSGDELQEIPKRRQDLSATFTRNGAIYAFRTEPFLELGTLYVPPCFAYVMKQDVSVNVDSIEDFWLAERELSRLGNPPKNKQKGNEGVSR
jgi:CMP-N,N'-diacetyllegionaminic acid synthase